MASRDGESKRIQRPALLATATVGGSRLRRSYSSTSTTARLSKEHFCCRAEQKTVALSAAANGASPVARDIAMSMMGILRISLVSPQSNQAGPGLREIDGDNAAGVALEGVPWERWARHLAVWVPQHGTSVERRSC